MPEIATNHIPVSCFAPSLTDEKLAEYRKLADALGPERFEVKQAMLSCLDCVEAWWKLPTSSRRDVKTWNIVVTKRVKVEAWWGRLLRWLKLWWGRRLGEYEAIAFERSTFEEVPLEKDHVTDLATVTPTLSELQATNALLDCEREAGCMDKNTYDAAKHLVWHAIEIAKGREPLTQDVLPNANQ